MNGKEQKAFDQLKSENKDLKSAIETLKEKNKSLQENAEKYAPLDDVEKELAEKQTKLKELLGEIETVAQAREILEKRNSILAEAEAHVQELKKEAQTLAETIRELTAQYGAYENVETMLAEAQNKANDAVAQAETESKKILADAKQNAEKIVSEAQAEHDLYLEEGKKAKEAAQAEAEDLCAKSKAERAETERYVKEQRTEIEKQRERIIAEARTSARTMVEEAGETVKTYYAGKEAEGEARKEAILKSANDERDGILKRAAENAELTAQGVKEAAEKYSEKTRHAADEYAAQIRGRADKLAQEAEEKVKEEKDFAMARREDELKKAREDAEKIRADAREETEAERAALEEEKIQLVREQEAVAQARKQAGRYEERLKQREESLDAEVEERVKESYADICESRDRAQAAARGMQERNKSLEDKLEKFRTYKWNATEVNQFSEFLKKLQEKGLSFSEEVCAQLLDTVHAYKDLQKKYAKLYEEFLRIKEENSNLALTQSRMNNQDEELVLEKEKNRYLEDTAKSLLDELSKSQAVSRDDMLRPVRQAPDFLNKDLPLCDEKDEMKWLDSIKTKAEKSGLYFTKRQLFAYHTAQKIRGMSPLVVLAGISGTGKSELPKNYALYGGMHFLSIPVKPDWDSPASLFGYYNSIEKRFEASELLRAIWQMKTDISFNNQMLMVLLDEMNLAHPEQYFADILSKLETSRGYGDAEYDILLGGGESAEKIAIGSNILWTGTMNEDETTKGLSDKVIDRSTLITFPRPQHLRSRSVSDSEKQKLEFVLPRSTWNGWLKQKRSDGGDEFSKIIDKYRVAVEQINGSMSKMGRNLGHRVWQGIEEYVKNYPEVVYAKESDIKPALDVAFTDAVAFKIMPKLRGVEVRGRNEEYLDQIQQVLSENAPELKSDFENARNMTTELFQWNSAEFMNDSQGKN